MSAFLYLWNPKEWTWWDLDEAIYLINNGQNYDIHWSCGNRKKGIQIGDLFFLMRLGFEPKGIIGCGYILSTPYQLPHWNKYQAADGKKRPRTDLRFKALSKTPIYPLSDLKKTYPHFNWTPQTGGIYIDQSIAENLFRNTQEVLHTDFQPPTPNEIKSLIEGKLKELTIKTYDRNPIARQKCIEAYGYSCSVCGFNFNRTYGSLGSQYIEVHHLKPIAEVGEEYEIDPKKDLRPVCANCHRMLHKTRPPLSIEELKNLIESIN